MLSKENLVCPVCLGKNWEITGSRIYRQNDKRWTDEYRRVQKTVFFDIWNNKEDSVHKDRLLCKECGFVTDADRPDENDISAKYQFLSNEEKYMGAMHHKKKAIVLDENRQSINLLHLVNANRKNREPLEILDYGGGDGHFLLPLKNLGHECLLADYNMHPVPGIRHIGKDLDDLDKKSAFDLVICRHVLEHVADPKKMLNGFRKLLKNEGMVFVEVPIELVSEKKPATDPVTHINFFQEKSLGILFRECGYKTIIERKNKSKYHGSFRIVAQVLAMPYKNEKEKKGYQDSYRYTNRLINVSKGKKRLMLLLNEPMKFIKYGIKKIFR